MINNRHKSMEITAVGDVAKSTLYYEIKHSSKERSTYFDFVYPVTTRLLCCLPLIKPMVSEQYHIFYDSCKLKQVSLQDYMDELSNVWRRVHFVMKTFVVRDPFFVNLHAECENKSASLYLFYSIISGKNLANMENKVFEKYVSLVKSKSSLVICRALDFFLGALSKHELSGYVNYIPRMLKLPVHVGEYVPVLICVLLTLDNLEWCRQFIKFVPDISLLAVTSTGNKSDDYRNHIVGCLRSDAFLFTCLLKHLPYAQLENSAIYTRFRQVIEIGHGISTCEHVRFMFILLSCHRLLAIKYLLLPVTEKQKKAIVHWFVKKPQKFVPTADEIYEMMKICYVSAFQKTSRSEMNSLTKLQPVGMSHNEVDTSSTSSFLVSWLISLVSPVEETSSFPRMDD